MNAKQLAALLNGRERGDEITSGEASLAKEHGLVVVFGASDDLIEFRGAIYDEADAYDGGAVIVDSIGLVPDRSEVDGDDDALKSYFYRKDHGFAIDAVWGGEIGYSWSYVTEIDHEAFDIMNGSEKFCRGIVFSLADLSPVKKRDDLQLKIKKLHPDAIIPAYQSAGAACFDLHALISSDAEGEQAANVLATHSTPAVIRTGLAFEVPEGFVLMIYSRSGHGFKHDVRLANCVGVIDSDYRGEVQVKLTNDGKGAGACLRVAHGDRIAQAMLIPVQQVRLLEVDELSQTERGTGGFGSTGA